MKAISLTYILGKVDYHSGQPGRLWGDPPEWAEREIFEWFTLVNLKRQFINKLGLIRSEAPHNTRIYISPGVNLRLRRNGQSPSDPPTDLAHDQLNAQEHRQMLEGNAFEAADAESEEGDAEGKGGEGDAKGKKGKGKPDDPPIYQEGKGKGPDGKGGGGDADPAGSAINPMLPDSAGAV